MFYWVKKLYYESNHWWKRILCAKRKKFTSINGGKLFRALKLLQRFFIVVIVRKNSKIVTRIVNSRVKQRKSTLKLKNRVKYNILEIITAIST